MGATQYLYFIYFFKKKAIIFSFSLLFISLFRSLFGIFYYFQGWIVHRRAPWGRGVGPALLQTMTMMEGMRGLPRRHRVPGFPPGGGPRQERSLACLAPTTTCSPSHHRRGSPLHVGASNISLQSQ